MIGAWLKSCVDYFTQASDVVTKAVEGAGVRMSLARFVTGLVAMVPVNFVAGYVPKGSAPHLFGAASTIGLLAFSYGWDVEQFVYAGALVYLLMKSFPRKCGYLTWATVFTYQIYLHYERSSEAAWNSGDIDFTGSFMMLVLKLITLSMDYQDGVTGKKTKHAFTKMPTLLEFCGYLGGMNGIMVGPHFYYDDYVRYANDLGEYATPLSLAGGRSRPPGRSCPPSDAPPSSRSRPPRSRARPSCSATTPHFRCPRGWSSPSSPTSATGAGSTLLGSSPSPPTFSLMSPTHPPTHSSTEINRVMTRIN